MKKNDLKINIIILFFVFLIILPIIILFIKNIIYEKDNIIYLIHKTESLNYYSTSTVAFATLLLGCVAYKQNKVINRNAKKPVIDIKDNSVCDGNIEMTIINNSNNDAYSISVNNNTIIADRLKANKECKVILTFKYNKNKNNIKKIQKKI